METNSQGLEATYLVLLSYSSVGWSEPVIEYFLSHDMLYCFCGLRVDRSGSSSLQRAALLKNPHHLHVYTSLRLSMHSTSYIYIIHRMTSHYTYIHNNQYISRAYIYQYIHYQIHYVQYTTYCIYIVICELE